MHQQPSPQHIDTQHSRSTTYQMARILNYLPNTTQPPHHYLMGDAGCGVKRVLLNVDRSSYSKTLSLEISDRDFRQIAQLAKMRGITTEQLVHEVLLESRAVIAAEIRFRRRAKRGAGKEVKGFALLNKAAGLTA